MYLVFHKANDSVLYWPTKSELGGAAILLFFITEFHYAKCDSRLSACGGVLYEEKR